MIDQFADDQHEIDAIIRAELRAELNSLIAKRAALMSLGTPCARTNSRKHTQERLAEIKRLSAEIWQLDEEVFGPGLRYGEFNDCLKCGRKTPVTEPTGLCTRCKKKRWHATSAK